MHAQREGDTMYGLWRSSTARTGLLALSLALFSLSSPAQDLAAGFAAPPPSARPHTWWHWMNGNITAEGITADLEAMAAVGVGGVQIFDVEPGVPAGPVDYASPEWFDLVLHACREADRLGLEVCLHNCAGWSCSGGPWVTPELAMQMLVSSETRVEGPGRSETPLPQPLTRLGTYRDIAVIAFPTPPAEASPLPEFTVTANHPGAAALLDGDLGTPVNVPSVVDGEPVWVAAEFAAPVTLRSLSLPPVSGATGGGELSVSEDGANFTRVADFGAQDGGLLPAPGAVCFPPATGRVFRITLSPGAGRGGLARMSEIVLEQGARLTNWSLKAGYDRANSPGRQSVEVGAEACVDSDTIVDLTARLQADGTLDWEAPAGSWTILRLGYTPTGKENHPASESGRGLEVDKLSKEAASFHFDQVVGALVEAGAPIGETGLRHVLIDSYEVHCQNWTAEMPRQFQRLRGYGIAGYLPALTGRIVADVDSTERFLWDFRRTLADLYHECYFGRFADLCHSRGLLLSAEPYGNGNFDDLTAGGAVDIPMGEFWVGGGPGNGKLAASIAHTYGRAIVGAESFTASDVNGRWQNHPGSLKALGDQVFCAGVNRYIFHRYAHQPWMNVVPGMTMGPWGFHFERTNTWWEQGAAWLQYIARCQYLLQSGEYVADFLAMAEENSPASMPLLNLPPGYEYDACSPEVVMKRLSVKDGWLVASGGSRYRALILPPGDRMTPALLERVAALAEAGATVVGPTYAASPSLSGGPPSDARVAELSGSVRQGTVAELLRDWALPPDFEVVGGQRDGVSFIHRRIDGAEVYFVASAAPQPRSLEAAFRVSGLRPELWDPVTGATRLAPVFREEDGRTTVSLAMEPAGSVFVVFREPVGEADPVVSLARDGGDAFAPTLPEGLTLEVLEASYGVLDRQLPDTVDVTDLARNLLRDGRLEISASNDLAGDPAPNLIKRLVVEYVLDGELRTASVVEGAGMVLPPDGEAGQVEVRRAMYGVVPDPLPPPDQTLTVDVTEALRQRIEGASLAVSANNDLAGDPAHLVPKQLRVQYALSGQPYTLVVPENQLLVLPTGTEAPIRAAMRPTPLAEATDSAAVAVTAWEDGEWTAETRSGATARASVAGSPEPQEISGDWTVSFGPNLGAPVRVLFSRLMSWTEHPTDGVRYYSGTATYTKTIDLPAVDADHRLLLDLGDVREMARVRLNGVDLGVLWKHPFSVDITDAAAPGENELEIEITNLWLNRLIGDEQLPDDCEWNSSGSLRGWPEWFLQGQKRPSERVAFTTWKHWHASSALVPSGLMGPVRVYTGQVVHLRP